MTATNLVRAFVRRTNFKMITDYKHVDMVFWLSRKNSDSHNYKKLIFDCLEHGGFVSNDCFIMDRTQEVHIDPKNPRVAIYFDEDL